MFAIINPHKIILHESGNVSHWKNKQQKIKNFHKVSNKILFLLLKITEVKIMKFDEIQLFYYPEESFLKTTRQFTKLITLPRMHQQKNNKI